MPFVLRKVEPRHLCRGHVPAGSQGWPVGAELEAVANGALTTSLKQLASILATAEDIFADLTAELTNVADRSTRSRSVSPLSTRRKYQSVSTLFLSCTRSRGSLRIRLVLQVISFLFSIFIYGYNCRYHLPITLLRLSCFWIDYIL